MKIFKKTSNTCHLPPPPKPCWKWTSSEKYITPPFSDIFISKLYGSFFNKYSKQRKKIFEFLKKIEFSSFFLLFRWVCSLNLINSSNALAFCCLNLNEKLSKKLARLSWSLFIVIRLNETSFSPPDPGRSRVDRIDNKNFVLSNKKTFKIVWR